MPKNLGTYKLNSDFIVFQKGDIFTLRAIGMNDVLVSFENSTITTRMRMDVFKQKMERVENEKI